MISLGAVSRTLEYRFGPSYNVLVTNVLLLFVLQTCAVHREKRESSLPLFLISLVVRIQMF